MLRLFCLVVYLTDVGAVFTPDNGNVLRAAVATCLNEANTGDCSTFAGTIWDGGSDVYGTIDSWDVSKVTDLSRIFYNAASFDSDLSTWNVARVTTLYQTFYGASKFTSDLSTWNVENVLSLSHTFHSASSFTSDLSKWNVERVTTLFQTFCYASSFTSDLSKWNVGKVINLGMLGTFRQASSFTSDLSKWNVERVTTLQETFESAVSFTSDLSKWNVEKVTNLQLTFYGASSFTSDLSKWNVARVIYLSYMFTGASSFTSDLASWNVARATTMDSIFSYTSIDTSTLCGRAWVESTASSKPPGLPTATSDICAPCSSIADLGVVDNFCASNGNNNLVTHAAHFMCDKDPCNKTIDAPTCCACGHESGLTINPAPCACGTVGTPNLCASSNMYCNAALKVCATFTIPTCEHTNGLALNLNSCACGSKACESSSTTGLYCTATKSNCRKYPLCPNGGGKQINTANCACGINDEGINEDCLVSSGNMFCYEPLSQCKPTNISFDSGDNPSTVTGPVCDYTDGSKSHTSSSSCVCGKSNGCTSTNGLYCYAPESKCQATPDLSWVPTCNSTDNSDINTQVCGCGANICVPSANGPYCLSSVSRCSCAAGKFRIDSADRCELCSAGTFAATFGLVGGCTGCPAGKYGTATGQTSEWSCQNCSVGKASYVVGTASESSCEDCLKGTYADVPSLSSCKICQRGYATDTTGSSSCAACLPGQFNADDQKFRLNHHSCDNCSLTGLPVSGNAAWYCETCPSGWEKNNKNNLNPCVQCPNGWKADGSAICQKCGTGQYQLEHGSTFCIPCTAGTYAAVGGQVECKACPINWYSNQSGLQECKICETGKTSMVLGQTFCTQCDAGQYMLDQGCTSCPGGWTSVYGEVKCDECTKGNFVNGLVCASCGAGTYGKPNLEAQDRTSAGVACDPCPQGMYSSAKGVTNATDCNECPPGKASNQTGNDNAGKCVECPLNTYADTGGLKQCMTCREGQISAEVKGSTFCKQCEAGTFMNATEQCEKCNLGQFSNQGGQFQCKTCEQGQTSLELGQTFCTQCEAGQYMTNDLECKDCTVGKYTNRGGQSNCTNCAAAETSTVRATFCSQCEAGTFMNTTKQCQECDIGEYSNQGGQLKCKTCVQGQTSKGKGQTYCSQCEAGKYMTVELECLNCGPGQYSNKGGQINCTNCSAEETSTEGSTFCSKCDAGKFMNLAKVCEFCFPGKVSTYGKKECTSCEAGYYSSADNSTCTTCIPGTFSDQNLSVACKECEIGQVSTSGQSKCDECLAGSYTNVDLSGCEPCAAGKYSEQSRQTTEGACLPCKMGTYSSARGAGSIDFCTACQPGRYSNTTQNTIGCKECPTGYMQDSSGSSSCKLLGKDAIRLGGGAAEVKVPPGSYLTDCTIIEDDTSCTGFQQCPSGWVGSAKELVQKCSPCPKGTSSFQGTTDCQKCSKGTYSNTIASAAGTAGDGCQNCPLGFARNRDENATQCQPCELGKTTTMEGAATCDTCEAGTFGVTNGVCAACPTGFYQDSKGQTECSDSCSTPGKIPNKERTGCELPPWGACKVGEYLNNTDHNNNAWQCVACPDGAECSNIFSVPHWSSLRHQDNYWNIPKSSMATPFMACPRPNTCLSSFRNGSTNCTAGHRGPLCAVCKHDHFRNNAGLCVSCEGNAKQTMENLIFPLVLLFVLVLVVCVKRKKIKQLRQKYGNVLRDVLRIVTINLSYAQINSSLPLVLTVPWPKEYLLFLEKMNFVNFDIMGMVGIGCVKDVDFRWRVAMASFVPIGLLICSGVVYLCRQTNIQEDDPVVRRKIVNDLFVSADVDGNGIIDVTEFEHILDEMLQPKTTVEAMQTQMKQLGARTRRGNVVLSREVFVKAASGHKLEALLGNHWVKHVALSRARSERWSNTLIWLFLMHAPVSQRLFYYFSCTTVGKTDYLVQDYSIECWSGDYTVFAPYVVFMLVVYTFGLPLLVSGVLLSNRQALYNPKVHAIMGFLYARFQKGSEFWEMHEVVRKCALMGLLIFLPSTSRAAVGILICVVCCCTLNYFQPHRSRLVLFVSQMSFLMSTFKYVCAVFLRLNDLKEGERQAMGWILVLLDVVFMVASVVAFVLVIVLLRAIAVGDATNDNDEVLGKDNGRLVEQQPQSLAKVVPVQQQQQRSMLQNEIVALKWQKNMRQTLVKNTPTTTGKVSRVKSTRTRKVEEIERNHQNHRTMAVQHIKQQQIKRRDSLQLRVQARNQRKKNARETMVHVEAAAGSNAVNKIAGSATAKTEDGGTARKWLCKIGVKKCWKFVSKNIQQNKEKKPMLNRARIVNLFKKLNMVKPDDFLNRQFGTSGNIEPNVFMAWVFEAEIKMAKIDMEQIEQEINSTK